MATLTCEHDGASSTVEVDRHRPQSFRTVRLRLVALLAAMLTLTAACTSDADEVSDAPADTDPTTGGSVGEGDPTTPLGDSTPVADLSSIPAWSSPDTWPTGEVPDSGAEVTIPADLEVVLDGDVDVSSLSVEGELHFASSESVVLRSTGNIEVTGLLSMTPDSPGVEHVIEFAGVNESEFLGGGMEPLPTDIGLWVMGAGQLDLEGSPRRGWTSAVGNIGKGATTIEVVDASGWLVGDLISIAPTAPPGEDGLDGSGLTAGFHETTIADIDGRTVTLATPTERAHPMVAGSYTAEVMNLTRNVEIRGTTEGQAHLLIRSEKPQFVRWVSLDWLGVRDSLGRYPLHFHHSGMGSHGSLVEGVVARRSHNRAFVPHVSHGVTLRDVVAYDIDSDAAYWWDHGDVTNDLLIDHALSAGTAQTGFFLGRGTNLIIRDSSAVAVKNKFNAGGFEWLNKAIGNWVITDVVAHNNLTSGMRVWQNADIPQVIDGYVAFHNYQSAIDHGAYSNRYVYRNGHFVGNLEHAIVLQATSSPTPISFENLLIEGAGVTQGSHVQVGGSPIPAEIPALFRDVVFSDDVGSPVFSFIGTNPHKVVCDRCEWPDGTEIVSFEGDDPEVWLEVEDGGTRQRFLASGETVTVDDSLPATYGEGSGLLVEYFDNPDLTEPTFAALLVGTNDEWWINPDRPLSGSLPYYGLDSADGSSSRWSGELELPADNAGEIEFLTAYMGGVRLWIGGELIIDDWTNSALRGDYGDPGSSGLNAAVVELEAGRHDFLLESTLTPEDLDDFYGGPLSVYWRIGDGPIRTIPASQLYPSGPVPEILPVIAEVPR